MFFTRLYRVTHISLLFIIIPSMWGVFVPSPHAQDATSWDGQSRFTVLVMGLDRRPNQGDTLQVRTDTLLVISLDMNQKRLGILDIPRDLYFALPDASDTLARVNSLLVRGENLQEGGGFDYAVQTLQYNLGMYIDAYIAFDFYAFETAIDALGGLPIDVPYTINDARYPDMNYGYDPFFITPGSYVMDGETALKYARSRHNSNDYIRGERQLDVVEAVINRLRDPARVQTLITAAPTLLQQLNGHFYTNLPPEALIYVGLSALQLDDGRFGRGSLNETYSFMYAYRGNNVRVPDRSLLAGLLTDVFGSYLP